MKRFQICICFVLLCSAAAVAQTVAPAFASASTDIRSIITTVGGVIVSIVGLVGVGRAAYKFSHGDTDAATALVTAIVGLCLSAIAATF